MTTIRLPPSSCLHCGALLDAAAALVEGTQPSPGDMTLCTHCAGVLMFDGGFNLRIPSPEDMAALTNSERADMLRAQRLIRKLKD